MTRIGLITLVIVAGISSRTACGQGLSFRALDAETGHGLTLIDVQRQSSYWEPRFPYFCPFAWVLCVSTESLRTDSSGTVRFEKVGRKDSFYFRAEGYIPVRVSRGWWGYRISEEPFENSLEAAQNHGIIQVYMRRKTPK